MASDLTTAAPHAYGDARAGQPPLVAAAGAPAVPRRRAAVAGRPGARSCRRCCCPAGRARCGSGRLIWMDGQWFRLIAIDWYDRPYVDGLWSEYPFFPLFPTLGGAPDEARASRRRWRSPAISWLAALAAMAGAYRLAVRHLPPAAAPWAPWFLAIAPGAVTMVLGYADSLYLAGLVWALVLAEDRRWWAAGLLAAVATASRPNGVDRRRRRRRHRARRPGRASGARRRRGAVRRVPRRLVLVPVLGHGRSARLLVGQGRVGRDLARRRCSPTRSPTATLAGAVPPRRSCSCWRSPT